VKTNHKVFKKADDAVTLQARIEAKYGPDNDDDNYVGSEIFEANTDVVYEARELVKSGKATLYVWLDVDDVLA
jgi:hypothetical protein